MSPLQQKPILHGRDHCPGGADPIPCMIGAPSGDFEGILLGLEPYAYWRLGETGEPWADTSGFGTAADLEEAESGTALTPDVTGGLPVGQDDGALEFNYDGTSSSGGRYAKNSDGLKTFDLGEMTVCAWVNVKASATSRRGMIVGNSEWHIPSGGYQAGWALQVVYPGRTIRFTRGQPGSTSGSPELYAETAGGVVADEWNFFVGTYDGDTIRLYANAELVDSTAAAIHTWDTNFIRIGYGQTGASNHSWFYGTVDEAAVWTQALTQAEINALYTAGVGGAGLGWVLTTDGSGGTTWAPPTIEVEF